MPGSKFQPQEPHLQVWAESFPLKETLGVEFGACNSEVP